MAEIFISIAAKVSEYLVDPIGRQISYAFKYERNMEELKKRVKKLTNRRESVQNDVDEAKRQGEEIKKEVQDWLDSVDEFVKKVVKPIIDDQVKVLKLTHERESVQHPVDEANRQGDENEKQVREWLNSAVAKPITDDSVKANKLCSIGFCHNLKTRYSLSKKAAKAGKDGVDLFGEGKFQKVSYRLPPRRTNSLIIKGYEDFASRKSLSESIMKALADADVDLIGVYGMGGVGKTTLVKKVAQQAKENKLFDLVVTAEVTETPEIRKIQGQIADELGLKFQEESVPGRAARLRERMKKEKRMLVILDNVWAKLDLESIGIPIVGDEKGSTRQKVDQGEGENANKRQCKIVFTSRNLDVLRNDMDTQKNFNVEILSDTEGESLFRKIVGYSEEKSDLNPIAVEIVGKCGGLPVAIKTIANALKNKSLHVWKNALDELKKADPINIKGMNAGVYSTIELSFNYLENEEAKSLFLFCSLCNSGYGVRVTELLKYGMGLGLFQDCYTLEEGRNKLHTLIDYLKASCLLMDDGINRVKMHDIIHTVAVSISSTTKLWFNLQDAVGLKEALEKKLPKDSAAVSLFYRDVYELPEKMEFPKLEQFLLYMEDASVQISDAVFEGMKGLKVLDMTGIHLLTPPSSLRCLINLHTLCLDHCQLEDVAIVGELKELEILSFLKSNMEHLPREIGQLTRLRLLDLSHCSKLKVIKPNVISSLTRLEELYMGDSFYQWDIEGQSNASLAELKQLSCLTALHIHVPNAHIIPQDLSFGKLETYRIFIGEEVWDWSDENETSRTLKLKLSSSIYLSNEIKSLLNRTEDVHLDKLKGVKSVVYELSGEGFPQLKHLHVQNGSDIQYIANSFGWGLYNVFPRLESLILDNLINLEEICHGQLAPKSFSKLRIMKVRKCDRLKHLFSFSMVNNLSQLQEIKVTNCKRLEEIISKESMELVHQNESTWRIEFTQLHTLTLKCLPQLTSFSFDASTHDIGSQEIVAEDEADGFMSLFSQNAVLPSLKNLKLSSVNIRCTWLDQLPVISSCCQALTDLTLKECNDLMFLFSYSAGKSLVQLQNLEIRNCKSIEGIIKTEELRGEEKMIMMVFPKLLNLQLKGLPKLSRFSSGNSVEFLSLTQISIKDCPNLKTFFSSSKYKRTDIRQSKEIEEMNCLDDIYPLFNEKVMLPTLASINLSSIPIRTIWHDQLQPMSSCFQNLKEIIMDGCDTLKYVFSSSMVEGLIQLEVLEISNCQAVEVVTITTGERISNTWFPKLYRLVLKQLPELTTFCNVTGKSIELTSLAELSLKNCPKMPAFVSNSQRADMPATKEEQKNSEKNLQYSHIQPFFDEKVQLPSLASLDLSSIASQTICWHNQLQAHSACFYNLTKLTVVGCDNLKYLFQFSVAESLNHLEVLDIWFCELMEGVIITQGERKSRTPFRKLKQLDLRSLPELTRFCNFNGNYSIELSSLSELIIWNCPKMQTFASNSLPGIEETEEVNTETEENLPSFFDEKVSFSCLKKLELRGQPELLHMWKKNSQPIKVFENLAYLGVSSCRNLKTLVPSSVSLQNLETLKVRNCEGLISLVTFSTSKSLEKLKRMEIIDCKLIEEIIIDTGDEINDVIVFNQLEYLKLQDLPSLTSFCKGSFTIEFPYLQRVLVIGCLKMMNFSQGVLSTPKLQSLQMTESSDEGCWEGDLNTTIQKLFRDEVGLRYIENFTVSNFSDLKEVWHEKIRVSYFRNLKSLVVDYKCCSLRYIFTPSVALGLVQLQRLEIKNCVVLEVITVVGEETISSTMFPNLNSLELINLPNLKCFCNFAGNSIELPSMTELSIKNCPNMETFISNFLGVDMSTSKDNCHTDIQPLFDEKVGLPNLAFLRLDKMDKLRKIWHHQLNSDSFCKLYSFRVLNCHNMLNFIPSNMFGRLQKLELLRLTNCSSLYEIFELQASGCGKTQAITATQLKYFELKDLPKLKHIWDVDSQGLLTCQNLILIEVTGCGSLKSIFPASVGRNLFQLKKLCIENCCMVEEIFAEEEQVDEAGPQFPQLFNLRLAELPRLRSFYPRVHISKWPMLKELQVWNCDKVKVSASKIFSFQVTHEMPLDQPLLLLDKVPLTNLERLGLDWKWFEKEALHEKLPEYSCKLNFLTIEGFHKGADICVFCFLHKLPNLDKLQVSGGFFKGLFLCEGFGCEEKHVEAPTKLSYLRLLRLNDSLHLWEENSLSSKGFQNLAILEVDCCSNIKSLVPSSVSFQNLTRLEVSKCNELLNLVAVPTAKSLVQLTELSISECKTVEEIIIHEGDEVKDRIVFKKLRNLELKCLPNLTSFYSGSYTIVFPYLQQVVVSECPNMKIFSRGVLSTPRLHRLQTTQEEGKGFWKGNLNTAIEHLFIENGQSCTEN